MVLIAACNSTPSTGAQPDPDGGTGTGGQGTGGDASAPDDAGPLTLGSSAFQDQGTLPVDYTCDGAGTSPPLSWTGIPQGTVELCLLMTTLAKDGLKWNWVLYHLPPAVTSLSAGEMGAGKAGLTSDGPELAYSPPCSQGPGAKTYTFTLHALSAAPEISLPDNQVTGKVITDAISGITLAESALSVSYTRP
jgi:phosphatidylethanolamine-binding protein (PEBP) family uncharacterized protein